MLLPFRSVKAVEAVTRLLPFFILKSARRGVMRQNVLLRSSAHSNGWIVYMAKKWSKGGIVSAIVMGVLTLILLPVLIINVTLIIKGSQGGDAPPDVFGIAPLAVTSPSMTGSNPDSFGEGALIFVKILSGEEKQTLKEGDIVTYHTTDAVSDQPIYVTHRIVKVNSDEGKIVSVVTQGDANTSDDGAIAIDFVVGKCVGSVEGLGAFAMFLQTPVGILVFVGIPVIAFIAYDAIRITLYNRKVAVQEKSDKLLADKDEEIARLRAMLGEDAGGQSPAAEGEEGQSPEDNGSRQDY